MMGKLANVLKAIGRFINRAIIDMTIVPEGGWPPGGSGTRSRLIDRGRGQELTGGRA
jgi:hypothetical protein